MNCKNKIFITVIAVLFISGCGTERVVIKNQAPELEEGSESTDSIFFEKPVLTISGIPSESNEVVPLLIETIGERNGLGREENREAARHRIKIRLSEQEIIEGITQKNSVVGIFSLLNSKGVLLARAVISEVSEKTLQDYVYLTSILSAGIESIAKLMTGEQK